METEAEQLRGQELHTLLPAAPRGQEESLEQILSQNSEREATRASGFQMSERITSLRSSTMLALGTHALSSVGGDHHGLVLVRAMYHRR